MLFFLIYTVFCTVSSCSATTAGYYLDEPGFNTSVLYFNPNLWGFNLKVRGLNPQLSDLVFVHLGGVIAASCFMHFQCCIQ